MTLFLIEAIVKLVLWANSSDGQMAIAELMPQEFDLERATKQLIWDMEKDGTMKGFRGVKRQWRKIWKK